MCEKSERRAVSLEKGKEKLRDNDRRGRRKGKEHLRKTVPERWSAEPAAPSQPSSSPPVGFAMVTRQGSQCSRLMCFSAAGTSWVLMCLSLSPEQSMSTVLGCTNTRRAESQGTLSHTGWVSGPEPDREALLCSFNSPENFYLSSLQEPNITR